MRVSIRRHVLAVLAVFCLASSVLTPAFAGPTPIPLHGALRFGPIPGVATGVVSGLGPVEFEFINNYVDVVLFTTANGEWLGAIRTGPLVVDGRFIRIPYTVDSKWSSG